MKIGLLRGDLCWKTISCCDISKVKVQIVFCLDCRFLGMSVWGSQKSFSSKTCCSGKIQNVRKIPNFAHFWTKLTHFRPIVDVNGRHLRVFIPFCWKHRWTPPSCNIKFPTNHATICFDASTFLQAHPNYLTVTLTTVSSPPPSTAQLRPRSNAFSTTSVGCTISKTSWAATTFLPSTSIPISSLIQHQTGLKNNTTIYF